MSRGVAIREKLEEINPEAVLYDGLDDALVGVASRHLMQPVALYDHAKILEVFIKRDGMTYEEAAEFYDFNIGCLWTGEGTPLVASFEVD